jgi:hypothetical protein
MSEQIVQQVLTIKFRQVAAYSLLVARHDRSNLFYEKNGLAIQEGLEQNRAGYRKLPGTELKNVQTGETVYTPPQDYEGSSLILWSIAIIFG